MSDELAHDDDLDLENVMRDLSDRANINYHEYDGKPVIVFEDHRTTLRVLKHAIDIGFVRASTNMIIFDHHDDFCDPYCGLERLKEFGAGPINERTLSDFVEWELCRNDDDWIKVGMHLGLIGDVLLVGAEKDHNIEISCDAGGIFRDMHDRPHKVVNVSHIWDGLQYQGWISDLARARELEPIWKIVGWDPRSKEFEPEADLVLDIDLDCFSADSWGQTLALRADLFNHLLTSVANEMHISALNWIRKCMLSAKYVSIATESIYCGGYNEMMNTFHIIDKMLFEGTLGRPF
jgi:hypothetical protein